MTDNKYTFSVELTDRPKPKPNPLDGLGFGKYFTDHISVSEFASGQWSANKIIPYRSLPMDPAACVFHYGQALFEGLKAFKQHDGRIVIFRPKFNAQRMQSGCERLCMQPVPTDLFVQSIQDLIKIDKSWIPEGQGNALYIRPTLIGSEGFLGVRPSEKYLFFNILSPVGSYYSGQHRGVKIWVETEQIRAAPGGLGAVKAAANYASSLAAASAQKKKGFDQVLWLDAITKDQIEEVGTMNVFFVFNDEIVTPSLNGSILPGGIRHCTLELLKDWKKPIVERPITMTELIERNKKGDFKEMFGTGTAAVITPVSELQYKNQTFHLESAQADSLSTKLYDEFCKIQYGEISDRFNWLTPLAT